MIRFAPLLLPALFAFAFAPTATQAEEVGCVSTTFRYLGAANDKICIEAFKDPDVQGVVCHLSRAVTGGIKGKLGLAEDTSDASIACRQVGPITLPEKLKDEDDVFEENRSLFFKELHVVRFYDKANNTLVYLSYSDRVIEGSPKNAISTVPIMPWGGNKL
ncbi:MAG: CreA family protein [Rhodospirillaceae bacterium]|nr:CreA family protein [Rhodospirillaceae bacterium]